MHKVFCPVTNGVNFLMIKVCETYYNNVFLYYKKLRQKLSFDMFFTIKTKISLYINIFSFCIVDPSVSQSL